MSNANTMIEDQIREEMRSLNSIMTDEADKPAIIQRIADLKAMLDDAPIKKTEQPTTRELIAELIKAIRHR